MELIRHWREAQFDLFLFESCFCRGDGKTPLGYALFDNDRLVFAGDDFRVPFTEATDSDATVLALLHFLTLQPGDTDRDYFAAYTPAQLDWAESDSAEQLRNITFQLEERINQ